jgi:hypothetical protein
MGNYLSQPINGTTAQFFMHCSAIFSLQVMVYVSQRAPQLSACVQTQEMQMYTRDEFYAIATEAQGWLEGLSDDWDHYVNEGVDDEDVAAVAEAAAALDCFIKKIPNPMPVQLRLIREEHRETVNKAIRRAMKRARRAAKAEQKEAA